MSHDSFNTWFKSDMENFAVEYLNRLQKVFVDSIESMNLHRLTSIFGKARSAIPRATLFFCGNGGSAATASHFANDLRTCQVLGKGCNAISLTDVSGITCAGNDFGYESCFVKQLESLFNPGDVVVGISASGNSENVIRALQYANENGGESVAIVGFDGGRMKEIAQTVVHVKSEVGEYGLVEDIHLMLDHLIVSYYKSQNNSQPETQTSQVDCDHLATIVEETEVLDLDSRAQQFMEIVSSALLPRGFVYKEGTGSWKRDLDDKWILSGTTFTLDVESEAVEATYDLEKETIRFNYRGPRGGSSGTVTSGGGLLGPDVVDLLRKRVSNR
jgi:D-sedoheptulose 7-phosphate isomerase